MRKLEGQPLAWIMGFEDVPVLLTFNLIINNRELVVERACFSGGICPSFFSAPTAESSLLAPYLPISPSSNPESTAEHSQPAYPLYSLP